MTSATIQYSLSSNPVIKLIQLQNGGQTDVSG